MLKMLLPCLALAACALPDDDSLATAASEENVWQWTDDVAIPGQTSPYQPGLAFYGSSLRMVYRGNNGRLYTTRFTGAGWNAADWLNEQTSDYGPAVAAFDGALRVVYHAAGQNRLLMSSLPSGTTWTSPVTAGTSIGTSTIINAPALAAHQNRLYLGYCVRHTNGTQAVRLDRFEGTVWERVRDIPILWGENESYDCKGLAMASLPDGRLDLVYNIGYPNRFCTGSTCWYMYEVQGFGSPPTAWTSQRLTNMKSKKPPAIVTCGATSHLVHGGHDTPEDIYWSFREGNSWTDDVKVPNQSSENGAALGCYEPTGRAIMAHNGNGTTALSWSEYGL